MVPYLEEKMRLGLYKLILKNRLNELDTLDKRYPGKSDFQKSAWNLRQVHRHILETSLAAHCK